MLTFKILSNNVLQEEDRVIGKCMINRILWAVMN
ncbi:helicase subunit [Klebsiella sp. H-Nf2]|nr:helicase subunit [Klebsiella sp. H-Nf2]